jgi:hypothetical protein
MGKVERKKCHQSGKVPLHEDAKSNVGGDCHKIAKKPPTCGICKQKGHTSQHCLMPPTLKRPNVELVEFDDLTSLKIFQAVQPKQKQTKTDFVAAEDWI